MKFYNVLNYNSRGEYCGHHVMAITDAQSIDDHKGDYDRAYTVTEREYLASSGWYRMASDEAKAELRKAGHR